MRRVVAGIGTDLHAVQRTVEHHAGAAGIELQRPRQAFEQLLRVIRARKRAHLQIDAVEQRFAAGIVSGGVEAFHPHARAAAPQIPQLVSGGIRQVDDALAVERPAVVDAHHHRLAGAERGDPRIAGNRQRGMRRGHGVHVVRLARRGLPAVKAAAVPRGQAFFAMGAALGLRGVGIAQRDVGAVGKAMQRFVARLRVGYRIQIRRRIGLGAVVEVIAALLCRRGGRRLLGGTGRAAAATAQRQGGGGQSQNQNRFHDAILSRHVLFSWRCVATLIRMPIPSSRVMSAVPP